MTLGLCMIVKNEQYTLARCLNSVQGVFNEIVIVDTGSTDNTVEIAKSYTDKVYFFEWTYDFSAARNFSFSKAKSDYLTWLDADDVLSYENKAALISLKNTLSPNVDMVFMRYAAAFDEHNRPTLVYERERIVKREKGYKFEGAVHEVIVPSGNILHSDITVFHKKDVSKKKDAERNLNIFRKLFADGKTPDERQKFYYARELYENGLYDAAVTAYCEFLSGNGWFENKICACRDLSACYKAKNMPEKELAALFKSFELDTPRAETCCLIGAFYMRYRLYEKAIFWYKLALNLKPNYSSGTFVFCDAYGFIPAIELCVCYDRLGDKIKAEKYNDIAGSFKQYNKSYLHNKLYFDKIFKRNDA